jgi:hypoxanthine phosphoribosyltransferase
VDEVDDSRKTLSYAVRELMRDVNEQLDSLPSNVDKEKLRKDTVFGVFVVHNKLKPKAAEIPAEVKYFSGMDIEDVWVDYPW